MTLNAAQFAAGHQPRQQQAAAAAPLTLHRMWPRSQKQGLSGKQHLLQQLQWWQLLAIQQ
jgi:hypothetical protein